MNEEWLLFGPHLSTADIRYPILLASKLTAVDEKDAFIFARVRMDHFFFLVVQLLPKNGMGLELKGWWGEPHMLKWKFWCLEADKGEESVQS